MVAGGYKLNKVLHSGKTDVYNYRQDENKNGLDHTKERERERELKRDRDSEREDIRRENLREEKRS